MRSRPSSIPDERVITIEDAAELRLRQPHVVRLESRPANVEGRGRVDDPRPAARRAADASRPDRDRRGARRRGARPADGAEHGPRGRALDGPRQLARGRPAPDRDAGADGRGGTAPRGDPRAARPRASTWSSIWRGSATARAGWWRSPRSCGPPARSGFASSTGWEARRRDARGRAGADRARGAGGRAGRRGRSRGADLRATAASWLRDVDRAAAAAPVARATRRAPRSSAASPCSAARAIATTAVLVAGPGRWRSLARPAPGASASLVARPPRALPAGGGAVDSRMSRRRSRTRSPAGTRCAARWRRPRESLEGPSSAELARVAADLELAARRPEDALAAMRARLRSDRVDSLATALLSQQVAGGDVARADAPPGVGRGGPRPGRRRGSRGDHPGALHRPARRRAARRGGAVRRAASARIRLAGRSPSRPRRRCWSRPPACSSPGFAADPPAREGRGVTAALLLARGRAGSSALAGDRAAAPRRPAAASRDRRRRPGYGAPASRPLAASADARLGSRPPGAGPAWPTGSPPEALLAAKLGGALAGALWALVVAPAAPSRLAWVVAVGIARGGLPRTGRLARATRRAGACARSAAGLPDALDLLAVGTGRGPQPARRPQRARRGGGAAGAGAGDALRRELLRAAAERGARLAAPARSGPRGGGDVRRDRALAPLWLAPRRPAARAGDGAAGRPAAPDRGARRPRGAEDPARRGSAPGAVRAADDRRRLCSPTSIASWPGSESNLIRPTAEAARKPSLRAAPAVR